LLALYLGQKRGLSKAKYDKVMIELSKVPVMIEDILADTVNIRKIAENISEYKNFYALKFLFQNNISD
jgi:glucosamine 6-phosphate synthetase-like amidotransferase/phosphosugar isomerase protein